MAQDRERLQIYKEKCRNYEAEFENLKNKMQQLEIIEQKADAKISALNKIHQEKSKSLMNSITLLKKENRALEKANSGGAQSKLIAQLNKDIQEQEIVINVLRQILDSKEIPQEEADNLIIKELNKGPPKIKAPSREEMKIEIKNLASKIARGGPPVKGGKQSLNNSRVSQKQDLNQTNQSMQQSQVSDNASVISEDRADSIENLITRIEELKRENDEIKLNLKAEQEIIEKYEDELQKKSEEINDLRSAKTDYTVLAKKYETLQLTIQEDRQNNNDKFISNYDNELRVEELEIITQKQQQKIRTQEETLETEKERNRDKVDELTQQINVLNNEKTTAVSKFQSQVERSKNLSQEVEALKTEVGILKKTTAINQDKNQRKIESLEQINHNLEKTLQTKESDLNLANQQLTKLKLRLEQTEAELDEVKLKGAQQAKIGDLGMITGGVTQASAQDTKELRNKVKAMTKKEIELQDQIESLTQEIQFREQREKVLNYVNKKQLGGNLQEQELKRKYQKEVQQRYESQVRKLIIRVKELENHNTELREIHNMIQSQVDLVASDLSSDISVSLNALENMEINSSDSNIEDLQKSQEEIVQKDQKQLKKKLVVLKQREQELQDKVKQLADDRDRLKQNQPTNSIPNDEYERKIAKMQNEYDKIITQLSNKIADLELQDVRLSKIDSNIGSDILSQQQYDEKDIKDIDSNISFSINDIKRQEKSLSQVSSNIDSILMSDQGGNKNLSKISKISGQPQININSNTFNQGDGENYDDENLDNISSGISNISGMSNNKY